VSVVGAASMLGKIGGGWLSDFLRREIVYVLGMASVIAGIGVLGLVATHPPCCSPTSTPCSSASATR